MIIPRFAEFKEMLENTEKNATLKRHDFQHSNHKQRLSVPDLENTLLPVPQETKKNTSNKKERGFMMTIASSKPKLRKALRNLIPRNMSISGMNRSVDVCKYFIFCLTRSSIEM